MNEQKKLNAKYNATLDRLADEQFPCPPVHEYRIDGIKINWDKFRALNHREGE